MRIIAGEMRGRKLKTVSGMDTRPTADKVKGAIFNVLREKVANARVLDLFAGTGNLALEALSRGAREVEIVEKAYLAQKVIQENLKLTGEAQAQLFSLDAFEFLKQYPEKMFDLIFLDPPYRQGLVTRALSMLSEPCRLTLAGVIVAETASEEDLQVFEPFEIRKTSEYGNTKIWYIQRCME
ncbi:16S rRNA (guanine(966)-N(2))-methyltransferase RsmD [Desulfitobacterium sp.]|uniref:16S rRNA (guanine(966)-N(2))-methyltransferase RsmD n=1 Tax=Desulfitobacterium sp. TaxID=49981 RepID=UPI002C3048E7|nr:16S rRNA (guanine(966)-N(2))-methyltransferase RsmD [Desulfitobacterium sp.]HVJ50568.1 16S rRNA (guanine(966)-N(2))-methyltransferase RsmD [Desulfitobacterium sp.]